ncbi:MAG: hypothetical protein RIB58_01500 [Phycisphaerales bacterium]|jgi:gas vesicle protein
MTTEHTNEQLSSGGPGDPGQELEDRVRAKAKRMEAKILELRADASESARTKADEIQRELDEALGHVKEGLSNAREETLQTLNDWVKKM